MIQNIQEEVDYLFTKEGIKALKKENESMTLKVIEIIQRHALLSNVSDVHFEPQEDYYIVRFRLDGVLYDVLKFQDIELRQSLISSIRAQANMHVDGTVKRKAQDGRWSTQTAGERIDYRISIVPVIHGEKLVMRIFRQAKSLYTLQTLGCTAEHAALFEDFLQNKNGIVFVTGPTGSGKTTTLYAGLNYLIKPEINIVTLEDPVEFRVERLNQSQIDPPVGFNFSQGLRALLRQDPDVVFVGEIRDKETSEIAIRASLTGHLVLTTIHTNDAPTAVTRLLDMGIEPFLIAATASLIINQRLLRQVCPTCKSPTPMPSAQLPRDLECLRSMNIVLYKAGACPQCSNTGYRGRIPVFEFIRTSDALRKLVLKKASTGEIREQALKDGMKTLLTDSIRYLREERTTLDEILQVIASS